MRPEDAPGNSVIEAGAIPNQYAKSKWRDIVVVVMVAWAARLVFICLVPSGSRSFDAFAWEKVADLLRNGVNPYQASIFLSWPPLWMQFVFVISKIAAFLNVPFFQVLRITLILIETAVIVQVMRLLQTIVPAANARLIAMAGIALNPVAILLVCQHCNFDVLMVLWVLLAAESLLRYDKSDNLMDWLCACMFLGLGILTKTVPLALVPLLAGGFRKATAQGRLLGATLVLGPPALGMSIIYVLTPSEVFNHVLEYRPDRTTFGFQGLMSIMGIDDFTKYLDRAFYVLGIAVMALTLRYLWKNRSLGNRETILYIAMILLAIPVLGPGFGSQYFYWFLPFLVIAYACFPGPWQRLLIGLAVIAAVTFMVQYGFNMAYGSNFIYLLSHATSQDNLYQWAHLTKDPLSIGVIHWTNWISLRSHQAIVWALLFIGLMGVLAFGTRILFVSINAPRKWVGIIAGCYAFYIIMVFGLGFGAKYIQQKSASPTDPNSNQIDRFTSP